MRNAIAKTIRDNTHREFLACKTTRFLLCNTPTQRVSVGVNLIERIREMCAQRVKPEVMLVYLPARACVCVVHGQRRGGVVAGSVPRITHWRLTVALLAAHPSDIIYAPYIYTTRIYISPNTSDLVLCQPPALPFHLIRSLPIRYRFGRITTRTTMPLQYIPSSNIEQ